MAFDVAEIFGVGFLTLIGEYMVCENDSFHNSVVCLSVLLTPLAGAAVERVLFDAVVILGECFAPFVVLIVDLFMWIRLF